MRTLRVGPGPVHVPADELRVDIEERLADALGEGEIPLEIALQVIVEDASDPARFTAMRDEEVFVRPALEALVGVGGVGVAGGLQPGVERQRVLLVGIDRVEVGAAAEPRLAGADVPRVHMRRRRVRRAQMRPQRDAARPKAAIALRAGHLGTELGAELAPDRRDVDPHLLEHATAHDADHAAATARTVPGAPLEPSRGQVAVGGPGIVVLDSLESGADPITQLLEPSARPLLLPVVLARVVAHPSSPVWRSASARAIAAADATLSERSPGRSGIRTRRSARSCTKVGAPALSLPSIRMSSGMYATRW